ncbi:MAG: hypothetical protein IV101_10415 [Dechloromonas sp.]|uniref:gamma-mobile-trio protein GmtX n=1 Tax=Dechloromonas sp. TaxID=1917218 RepID=UPI0027FD2859|nr:gamma-mobile-trio protein GmtX [Dechloromonas sp.]MBT9521298.1 hypothetical protein [Dechloromonas sp.]
MEFNAKDILDELCKISTARKQLSLRLIYKICEEQHQRGSRDFSIATIGRLSSENKGPSAAAIRNKTGEDYRSLIRVYAESVNGDTKKTKTNNHPSDNIVNSITDPVTRIRVNIILAEIKALRTQLNATRHLANQTAIIRIEQNSLPNDAPSSPELSSIKEKIGLSLLEIRALQLSIDEKTMTHWGWVPDTSGRILSESGQVIFHAGFISAVRKAIGNA